MLAYDEKITKIQTLNTQGGGQGGGQPTEIFRKVCQTNTFGR